MSAESVRCVVPPMSRAFAADVQLAEVPLWISPNGEQFYVGPANFTYLAVDPRIDAIHPPIGPIYGGTHVHVRGAGYGVARAELPFGDKVVPATAAADGTGVLCVSPSKVLAVQQLVEVTLNGEDWVGNASHAAHVQPEREAPRHRARLRALARRHQPHLQPHRPGPPRRAGGLSQ